MEGAFIESFPSLAAAERATEVSRPNINAAIRGRRRHAGGFRWICSKQPAKQLTKLPSTKTRATKVFCFTPQGKFVREYASAVEASKNTDAGRPDICSVIKGKRRTAGGYVWSDKPLLPKKRLESLASFKHAAKRRTAVVLYNAQGRRIRTFEKIGDAASYAQSSTTTIGQCARGEIEFVVTKKLGLCRFRLKETAPTKLTPLDRAPAARTRSVACYDKRGRRLAIYQSLKEAASANRTRTETIDQAIRLGIHAGGLRWSDHSARKPSSKRLKALADKTLVCQYDYHGKLVRTYSSIRAAARTVKRSYTTARTVIEGGGYSMAGFFWRRFPADKIPLAIKTPPPRAEGKVF